MHNNKKYKYLKDTILVANICSSFPKWYFSEYHIKCHPNKSMFSIQENSNINFILARKLNLREEVGGL